MEKMNNGEVEKAKEFIIVKIIEYVSDSVVIKSITKSGYE